jgi:hypothetical protein
MSYYTCVKCGEGGFNQYGHGKIDGTFSCDNKPEQKKEKPMTPLYSKETAEEYIDAANGRRELSKGNLAETNAIERLIENGNEIMEYLAMVDLTLCANGAYNASTKTRELIKKIKGEG